MANKRNRQARKNKPKKKAPSEDIVSATEPTTHVPAEDGRGTQPKRTIVTHQALFSGPIPPPEVLEGYSRLIPDAPERILKMAETQSKHRQKIEKWAVIGGTMRAQSGVIFAFAIAIATLYAGYRLIMAGHDTSGTIFGGMGLVGIVGAFIYGTRSRRQERERKYGKEPYRKQE